MKMSILNKEIRIVRKSGNERKYEKQVAEANRLSSLLQQNNLTITDESGTWQTPEKDHNYKYVNGTLYTEHKELDLYSHNKGLGTKWETKRSKVWKINMYYDNPLPTDMRLMRKTLKQNNIPF